MSLNVTFYKKLSCIYAYVYRLLWFQKKKTNPKTNKQKKTQKNLHF